MSSLFWFALPVFTGIIMLVQCQNPYFPATPAEREECEEHAGTNRKVIDERKYRDSSCAVYCKYDDGTGEVYHLPDGALCHDGAGVLPTGCCKDGKCLTGIENC